MVTAISHDYKNKLSTESNGKLLEPVSEMALISQSIACSKLCGYQKP